MSEIKDSHNKMFENLNAKKHRQMSSAIADFDSSGVFDEDSVMNAATRPKFERHKHRIKKSVKRRKAIIRGLIGFVTLLLVLILAILLMLTIGEYSMKAYDNLRMNLGRDAVSYDEGKTVYYNGNKYVFNENIVSIAFIGSDLGGDDEAVGRTGQADFLALIVMDTLTGKTRAITIPRDTMIETGEYIGEQFAGMNRYMQICMTYGFGDNGYLSCKYCTNAVERLFYDVPIKYYFSLNYRDVPALNDSIGGVTLTPIESIPSTSIVKDQQTTLSGTNAQKYVQYRDKTKVGSDQNRLARQKQYASSLVSQLFKRSGTVSAVLNIYNNALSYITTNIGANEVIYLTSVAMRKDLSNPDIVTINGNIQKGEAYDELWPDNDQIWELVLDTYYTKVSSSDYENKDYNKIFIGAEE